MLSAASDAGRHYLKLADGVDADGDPGWAVAAALSGLLAMAVEHAEQEDREETLSKLHDAADEALGRVLELADRLDAHPHATLKPTAFRDLATKIREAVG